TSRLHDMISKTTLLVTGITLYKSTKQSEVFNLNSGSMTLTSHQLEQKRKQQMKIREMQEALLAIRNNPMTLTLYSTALLTYLRATQGLYIRHNLPQAL